MARLRADAGFAAKDNSPRQCLFATDVAGLVVEDDRGKAFTLPLRVANGVAPTGLGSFGHWYLLCVSKNKTPPDLTDGV